ncbi:hypothetical protein A2U01_0054059, partial [Trifolium medium]|nr:hypothetical protein [Trifolium medium]
RRGCCVRRNVKQFWVVFKLVSTPGAACWVGVIIVTPWKHLLIEFLGHWKRFGKMVELGKL